jgi:hypothetical protein
MSAQDPLLGEIKGATTRQVGGVRVDVSPVGSGRVKRIIYPAGFRWSSHMKPVTGTDLCMHAHVGFLVRGHVQVKYGDGCVADFVAPAAVAIDPGHDGAVVGPEPAVLIEFDFEGETIERFGMPEVHGH